MQTHATTGPLFNWTQGIYALHAFSLLVGILGAPTVIGAFLRLGVGILIAWIPLVIVSLWFIYRIVRGWLALREGRPMYA